jgi:hypothetical protein
LALVRKGFPGEARRPVSALAAFLEAMLLTHPWADPELPSLVAEGEDGRVVGFIASHARHMRHRDREVRAALCSHLVVDPAEPRAGVAMQLLSRFMAGPQDLSLSDTAIDLVGRMWRAAGGRVDPLRSLAWMRVLRRARWAVRLAALRLARRRPTGLAPVRPLPLELPAAPGRADACELATLDPAALAGLIDSIAAGAPLRPAYDEAFVTWLFQQLDEHLSPARVVRRSVRRRGRAVGWFVYALEPSGRATVLELGAAQRDVDPVADALFAAAHDDGAVLLTGRMEPHLRDAVRRHRCAIGPGLTAVAHSEDPALLADLASAGSLWTRLAGEWW